MIRYAALLRGVAPSLPNMTNEVLRGVFVGLGLADVTSVLASGNILFRSPDPDAPGLERRIEDALARGLGLSCRTILRTHAELRALLDSDPFPGLTHGRGTYLTATFLQDPAAPPLPATPASGPGSLTRVVRYDPAARAVLAVTDNSVPGSTPDFMGWLERHCGKAITTRSWLTVGRLVAALER